MITFLERQRDESTGALNQLMSTLEKEYQCKDLEEAEELLTKLEREVAEYEETFQTEYGQFRKKYSKRLEKGGFQFDESISNGQKPSKHRKARD